MMFDVLDETRQPQIGAASQAQALRSDSAGDRRNLTGSAQLTGDLAQGRPNGLYARFGKRGLDLLGALVLILVFSPLILVIAFLQVTQAGGVLFSHRRVGRGGEEFGCLKFRTMVPDAEARLRDLLAVDADARREWQESRKLTSDPRITGVGNVLRKTSLDELPQLLNVLRGEMSLVGPRPVTRAELAMYGDAKSAYLALRPGLTGQWQVSGRNDVSYDQRVALDRDYAANFSLLGDLRILFQTVGVVLGATGR